MFASSDEKPGRRDADEDKASVQAAVLSVPGSMSPSASISEPSLAATAVDGTADPGEKVFASKYDDSLLWRVLTPTNCRWNPASPPVMGTGICVLYAFASTFTLANLYYCQPILNRIADTFDVTYEQSSQVATLIQAGYAVGLFLLLPLGDMLERRPYIIAVITFCATVWIGLCVTTSFTVFRTLSFICGLTTVTPQLMIPLIGDFAPPQRRGALISIVTSGVLGGMLVARLLSGVVANYTSWRNIYWIACGLQYLLALTLYLLMPDYPSRNPGSFERGWGYIKALWSIPVIMVQEPILVQASLIVFSQLSIFACFWTTVTFLLASDPYNYSPLVIGLFSLLTIPAMIGVPLYGRIIDRFVPQFSMGIGLSVMLVSVVVGTWTGNLSAAGPAIQAAGTDLGVQIVQVANRSAIFDIRPNAKSRVNTAYMAAAFCGQLTGTSIGNRLYAMGGWTASGSYSIGMVGFAICVMLARGPRVTGWVGWEGGWAIRKDAPKPKLQTV